MTSNTMFLIGGCSGSFAAPSENRPIYDPNTPRKLRRVPFRRDLFGSRTTSFLLRHKDTVILIDQGLGVEPLSSFLLEMLRAEGKTESTVYCLQTHFHDDHLDGLRSNALFFQKGLRLEFHTPNLAAMEALCGSDSAYPGVDYAVACPTTPTMKDILAARFCAGYWPVTLELLDEVGASREEHQFIPGAQLKFGEIAVQTFPLHHPGGCVGYRLEIPGVGAIAVATDFEPDADVDPAVVSFFDGTFLALADMQYRDAEYRGEQAIGDFGRAMSREGWGHATPERLLPILAECSKPPERLRIVHHDPKRPDTDLELFCDESVDQLKKYLAGRRMDFRFAREGEAFFL